MARLLFFAAIREAAGTRSFDVDAATVGEALKVASERFGARFEQVLSICTILHREEKVEPAERDGRALDDGDEIAILPPVSGGQEDDEGGRARFEMIDVGDKDETAREAVAVCRLIAEPATRDRIVAGTVKKGDCIGPAKVAGTLAAKRVPELIPLCHPVRMTYVDVACTPTGSDAIEVRATVRGRDRTGFEMEALTAASVAALTLYDMAKNEDPRMRIEGLRVIAKSGGKSGA